MNFLDSTSEEETYTVERIEKRRVLPDGRVEYFLKWKGWSSRDNTWEPEEHLECPELIEEFLIRQQDRKLALKYIHEMDANNNKSENRGENKNGFSKRGFEIPKINGFDKGYEAERILGATDCNGLTFLMKYKGVDKTELVPSKIVRYKCPHLVIGFFEKHITWHSVAQKK